MAQAMKAKKGQQYLDLHPRSNGKRTIRVVKIDGSDCTVENVKTGKTVRLSTERLLNKSHFQPVSR